MERTPKGGSNITTTWMRSRPPTITRPPPTVPHNLYRSSLLNPLSFPTSHLHPPPLLPPPPSPQNTPYLNSIPSSSMNTRRNEFTFVPNAPLRTSPVTIRLDLNLNLPSHQSQHSRIEIKIPEVGFEYALPPTSDEAPPCNNRGIINTIGNHESINQTTTLFPCEKCDFVFYTARSLGGHMGLHTQMKRLGEEETSNAAKRSQPNNNDIDENHNNNKNNDWKMYTNNDKAKSIIIIDDDDEDENIIQTNININTNNNNCNVAVSQPVQLKPPVGNEIGLKRVRHVLRKIRDAKAVKDVREPSKVQLARDVAPTRNRFRFAVGRRTPCDGILGKRITVKPSLKKGRDESGYDSEDSVNSELQRGGRANGRLRIK
ncbi:hypothetical protein QJS10_CPA10g00080 [Acorus calamus]|uniref:C2H2-type domain-containing protein n=1 Tax=Acorus calamus TaxID=4465 RepID=A0AAV9DZ65_ACOCL|nr:hypothetical protein QJS10_CPA10g00080 [Acorus calamus]